MSATVAEEVIWHDVECGAYAADLPRWRELAGSAAGPVLELGCGTGRVALHLAGAGFEVTALDSSPALVAELRRRAAAAGLELETAVADARELALSRPFAAILAPMQLLHLLGGPAGRAALLARAADHLAPGGMLAAALLAGHGAPALGEEGGAPLPDVLERDGWVYSSLPIEVRALAGGLELRRLRQLVSPGGELSERLEVIRLDELAPERLEAEAAAAGLIPRERIEVPPTPEHVGSVICVLEARR